jgi:hypothetical protein
MARAPVKSGFCKMAAATSKMAAAAVVTYLT